MQNFIGTSGSRRALPLRSGFTLIELLVVIAIISLLAAILFPVFGRARENARRVSCLSNLKQVCLAFQQYSQDYDENAVPVRVGSSTSKYFAWSQIIQPYLKSTQTLVCPSAASGTLQSYAYNLSAGGAPNRNISSYTLPSQTVFVIDAIGSKTIASNQSLMFFIGSVDAFSNENGRLVTANTTLSTSLCFPEALSNSGVHLEGSNYTFVDGHAKWLKYTAGATNTSACGTPPERQMNGSKIGLHREGVQYNPDNNAVGADTYR